jgi:hypothetical protein
MAARRSVNPVTTDGRHLLNGGKIPLIEPELLTEILSSSIQIIAALASCQIGKARFCHLC